MGATILGNLGTSDLVTLGGPVTINTGLSVTTLPNVSPTVIDVTGIDVDSYWHLASGKIAPENLTYKIGLGTVSTGNLSTEYLLLLNTTSNEVTKVAATEVALASHNQAWSTITSTPTTLSGYGITDAASSSHTHSYQFLDADLTAIAALGFASISFLKKTAANTWVLDTNVYEIALGNPAGNGYILSSDTNGIRSWVEHIHSDKENYLGVPGTNGYILSSDTSGNRSWVAQASGGSGMAMHANEYHSTLDNTVLSGTLTLNGVALTTTFTKLNYLTNVTGTTGTNTTNIVFSTSPVLTTPNIGAATGTSLTVTGDVIAYSA